MLQLAEVHGNGCMNDNGMTRGYERHERPCEFLAMDLEIKHWTNGTRIISRDV